MKYAWVLGCCLLVAGVLLNLQSNNFFQSGLPSGESTFGVQSVGDDCGNGEVDPDEICDLWWANGTLCTAGYDESCEYCANDCTLTTNTGPTCGDGNIDNGFEQCDDGNTSTGDWCSASCGLESCGNGVLDPGEACDDGNTNQYDGCTNTCTVCFPDYDENWNPLGC